MADERSPRALTGRFLAAAEEAGIPRVDDYNGPEQDGTSLVQVTQHNGRRWSANDAYLRPVRSRENLKIVTGAQVRRIEVDGGRATGVAYRDRKGREHRAEAGREVLLSAGALASPHLLMLSGIGPADQLREAGLDVEVDAPEVGQNLQDHPFYSCVWEVTGSRWPMPSIRATCSNGSCARSGPLTSSVAEAFAFVRSRPGLPAPDLQFHFAPTYFVDHGFDEFDGHALTLGPVLISPRSRGSLTLTSADPAAKPRIQTNTLAEPEDVLALVAGVKVARKIVAADPLAPVSKREMLPGGDAETDEDIAARIRAGVELLYHPVGTCRMGAGDDSVVDPELRVRGVDGLRVVDASIFPVIPGGNTNAPTIMVAERAADLIRGRAQVPAATA